MGKICFKLQITPVCEFHFNIIDAHVSAGRHRKALKPNVSSEFTFIKRKSSENQPERRSPRKRHLVTEFYLLQVNLCTYMANYFETMSDCLKYIL